MSTSIIETEDQEQQLHLLYEHYKNTCELNTTRIHRRNTSFVFLCFLEAMSFLIIFNPQDGYGLILNGINAAFETSLVFGTTVLQTLLWILIDYVLIRYVQDSINIERQYKYLKSLEQEVVKISRVEIFNREGDCYSQNYPAVLNIIDLFYKTLCPILFLIINTIHIVQESPTAETNRLAFVCDLILYISLVVILWSYFWWIHNKISGWCIKNIRIVGKAYCVVQKILKEV